MCDGCEKHPRALVDTVRLMSSPGELAIVLHTHMPYVEGGGEWPPVDQASFMRNPEGFGTWPFGEEWLWEAIATSYVPLLEVLDRAPLTLSLTPVLCDQLAHPGAIERCIEFLEGVRPETHRARRGRTASGRPAATRVRNRTVGRRLCGRGYQAAAARAGWAAARPR